MSDWKEDPATDAQKERLKAEGIKFSKNITKGEASDLIGSTVEPEQNVLIMLKFFKVSGISKMSQTDARKKLEEIFSNQDNKKRWEQRLAVKSQKDIYQYFKIPIPSGLRHIDAEQFISELFEDEQKLEAWESYEDALDDRESWFEDNFEMINDARDSYECKKISKKLFKQVVEALEASGMPLEQIEENEDTFFDKALEINPALRRAASNRSSRTTSRSNRNKSSSSGFGGIITIAIIILLVLWLI